MGNCCGGTATVPSEPEPAPQETQRATPMPVLSQSSTEKLPVPSPASASRTRSRVASEPESGHRTPVLSSTPSQTRSRAAYGPESTHHGRMSSQDSSHSTPRSRKKSAPQPFQSSKSSSPQKTRTRAETLSTPKGSSRSSSRRQMASRPSLIERSIEIGRNKYWHNLWSSGKFTDQPIISLKDCVELIHNDIVNIWNQDDSRCPAVSTAQRNQYLSSDRFKIYMSHVVKDPAVPAGRASVSSDWNTSGDQFADWVYDIYEGKKEENVRWLMGYIVNLLVILNEMFKTAAGNVTEDVALTVMETHVRSGCKGSIHEDIWSFVTETFPNRFADSKKDLVLEKIIDLIRQYCSLSGNS